MQFEVKTNIRKLLLAFLIFQSLGIRFFGGQGTFFIVLVIALILVLIGPIHKSHFKRLALIYGIITFFKIVNFNFDTSNYFYLLAIVTESYLLLVLYEKYGGMNLLSSDLYRVLHFFAVHAIFGILLYQIFGRFFSNVEFSGYPYQTLGYLFYVDRLGRNTGLLWEPGVLQFVLNIYLFFSIIRRRSPFFIFVISLAVLSTQSTTGFIILIFNMFIYISRFISFRKPSNVLLLLCGLIFCISTYSIVKQNFTEKFDVRNTSGLIRYRDLIIGSQLVLENPVLGHGIYNSSYLRSKNYVSDIEAELFSETYLERAGDLSGGYTNGLFAIFAWFGIPMGIYLLVLLFNNSLVKQYKLLFTMSVCITMISEPISYTPFFLLLLLSSTFGKEAV